MAIFEIHHGSRENCLDWVNDRIARNDPEGKYGIHEVEYPLGPVDFMSGSDIAHDGKRYYRVEPRPGRRGWRVTVDL